MKTKNSIQKNRKRITSDGERLTIRLSKEISEKIDEIMKNKNYEIDLNYSWGNIKKTSVLRHSILVGLEKILEDLGKIE